MPIQIDVASTHGGHGNGSSGPGKSGPIVGIDLGTTNSLVAIVENGLPRILNSREGSHLVPSVVSFVEGLPVVGSGAKSKKVRDAKHTVFSVKRLLGRSFGDLQKGETFPYEILAEDGVIRIRIADRTYTAVEISALILQELKFAAEKALGCSVSRAVITVPAYFNDAQRQATRTAGRIAGWDVLRIVNEPTAASLAYGLDRKKEGLIAVYDLGGGTFDVSILKLHDGIFEVLATNGDTTLGGDDLDLLIARKMAVEIQEQWGVDCFANSHLYAALLEASEEAKIALSGKPDAVFQLSYEGKTFQKKWTYSEFESLALPLLERTRTPCLKALQDAGLKPSDLSDVVLVGGPTRLQCVRDLVKAIFGREPNASMHPDEVVAEGAAIQADILSGNNKDLLLLDVVPLSLGLETYGGLMSSLISRNTRIPAVAREVFTTFVDNQTAVDIHVLQGERERVEDNRSLARFKLNKIQPLPAGMARVEVVFLVDADGILQVAAKDLKTGNEQSIEVRPTYGLTDSEVEKMLEAGMENAARDVAYRKLVEVRNEAEAVLRATEKNREALRLMSEGEAQAVERAIEELKGVILGEDIPKIQDASFRLNQATVRMAELMIQETISQIERNSKEKICQK